MTERPAPLAAWHQIAQSRDASALDSLLADDVVFRSPAVFKPQEGKAITTAYLTAAITVLGPTLRYTGEWFDAHGAVLEFEADLDGTFVQGVDIVRWNDAGQIFDFAVMVRPLKGLQALIPLMAEQLRPKPVIPNWQ
jgi:hypothetical protein